MSPKNDLIDKLYQAVNIMICELKITRKYGTNHKLTYSDICLLKSVQHNENTKAGDLSQILGITNGAVTQLAKKLTDKGYLEPYRITGNKKEIYYRLTPSGKKACLGHEEYYSGMKGNIDRYIEHLDNETIEKIIGLFDAVVDNYTMEEHCSIKHASHRDRNDEPMIGRCEKCKKIY